MSDLATRLATTPLSAGSAAYVEELYARYLDQPDSVPAEWQEFFATLKGDANDTAHAPIVEELRQRAKLSRSPSRSLPERAAALAAGGNAAKQGAVSRLIQIFMNRGHLAANIDYVLQSGGGIVLRNAEPIVGPLANLEQVAVVDPLAPEGKAAADGNVAASESASKDVGPATSAPGRPSFDCANAQTSGEAAVCADSGLAALDVNMSTQYRRALTTATPIQLQQLRTTRERFLAYRDRCPSRQCMADAYVGRMREIRDIMEGRFSPR